MWPSSTGRISFLSGSEVVSCADLSEATLHPSSIAPGTSKPESEHRRDICLAGQWLRERGFVPATDGNISVRLDAHRILIDETDRLENLAQIRALIAAGYEGPFSFEPFASEVHALPDPMTAAKESTDFVQKSL